MSLTLEELNEQPPEYRAIVNKMLEAGKAWIKRQSGDIRLAFLKEPPGVHFTGDLNEAGIQAYGLNESARELLRVLDVASNHEATIMMAIYVVDCLENI